MERSTVWFLRESDQPLRIEAQLEGHAGGVGEFVEVLDGLLEGDDQTALERHTEALIEEGAPEGLARRVARLAFVTPSFDVVRIAHENGIPVSDAAALYFAIGSRFGMTWLRRAAARLPADTAWDKRAVSAIVDDLFSHQSAVTRRVLAEAPTRELPGPMIERWAKENPRVVVRSEQLLAELQGMGTPKFSMLAVANRELKALYG